MGCCEDLGQLHPDGDQGVDVEEPPVVEDGVLLLPAVQLVVLPGEHVADLAMVPAAMGNTWSK